MKENYIKAPSSVVNVDAHYLTREAMAALYRAPLRIVNVDAHYPMDIIKGNYYASGSFSMLPHFFYEFNDDPNVYIIASDWCVRPTLYQCDIELLAKGLQQILTEDLKLCFDNIFEGNLLPLLRIVYKLIDLLNIKPKQIYCFTSALNVTEMHDYFCKIHNLSKKDINLYGVVGWEFNNKVRCQQNGVLSKSKDYEVKIKNKSYICWNRVLRWHRYLLVGLLSHEDLLDRGYVSLFLNGSHDLKQTQQSTINNYDCFLHDCKKVFNRPDIFSDITKQYEILKDRLPLTVNIEVQFNKNVLEIDDLKYFQDSYFSLVTETYFFTKNQWGTEDENSIFFTEKIFKPIIAKHPFIIVSRQNSLQWLKKLGYKTFHPFIDETYDSIENDSDRLLAIVEEVKRLCKQSDNQWLEWQNNIKDIVNYNFDIMVNKEHYKYALIRPNET
jgi:hypothetical protein